MRFPQTIPSPAAIPVSSPALQSAGRADAGTSIERMAYVCLCLFAFALPWSETGFTVNGIEISRWFGLAALGLVILRKHFRTPPRGFSDLHFWMLAFAGWSAASLFWTLDRDSTITKAETYIQLLLFAWVVWVLCNSESRVIGVLQSYVLGTTVIAIGVIENLLTGRTMGQIQGLQGMGSDRYTVNGVNPNDLGLMLALSIPMTLYLLAHHKGGRWTKPLLWVQLVLAAVGILLSGSRGGALAASGGVFLLPVILVRLSRLQKVVMALAVAAAVAAAISLVPQDTWQRFLDLGTDITQGTMTHRTQIWAASMVLFREHPMVGVGAGAHATAVTSLLGRPLVAHNTYMSALAELGVVGELLLLGMLGTAFYCAAKMPRSQRTFWILLMITWCIGAAGGTLEYRKFTWLLLSLLAAHAYIGRQNIQGNRIRSACVASPVF